MKISEVTVLDAIHKAKEDETDADILRDFADFLVAAKGFIKSYTGMDDEQMDLKEELTHALFCLINDMHDNRSYIVREDKLNPTAKTILEMHSMNLL